MILFCIATGCTPQVAGTGYEPSYADSSPIATSSAPPTLEPTIAAIAPDSTPSASSPIKASPAEPANDAFYPLPTHKVGEKIEVEGYGIEVNRVSIEDNILTLNISLQNNSPYNIDLGWAIQLRDKNGGFVTPLQNVETIEKDMELSSGNNVTQEWTYDFTDLARVDQKEQLEGYYLVFAPRGWSGPVIVVLLSS